jgi:hypothetical protein
MAKARSCTLSYAGRLQLLISILFSIQVHWSSLSILPKAIIVKITCNSQKSMDFVL